jgi:hypothetical protein
MDQPLSPHKPHKCCHLLSSLFPFQSVRFAIQPNACLIDIPVQPPKEDSGKNGSYAYNNHTSKPKDSHGLAQK